MLERQRDKGLKVGFGQIVESFVDRLHLDFILYRKEIWIFQGRAVT